MPQVKGNTTCDVCKAPIANLPDVPLPPAPLLASTNQLNGWGSGEAPSCADYACSCVLVAWVVAAVCIMALGWPAEQGVIAGVEGGLAYVVLAHVLYVARQRYHSALNQELLEEYRQQLEARRVRGWQPPPQPQPHHYHHQQHALAAMLMHGGGGQSDAYSGPPLYLPHVDSWQAAPYRAPVPPS